MTWRTAVIFKTLSGLSDRSTMKIITMESSDCKPTKTSSKMSTFLVNLLSKNPFCYENILWKEHKNSRIYWPLTWDCKRCFSCLWCIWLLLDILCKMCWKDEKQKNKTKQKKHLTLDEKRYKLLNLVDFEIFIIKL